MPGEAVCAVPVLSSLLQRMPGLVHGFSTREGGASTAFRNGLPGTDGDLNLGYSEQDLRGNVCTNRTRWLQALDVEPCAFRYALLKQEHTSVIHGVEADEAVTDFALPGTRAGDGLITSAPGVLLTVQTADCVPVLLADPVRRVVGAFHAGWRGTLARIVEQGVRTMQLRYGTVSHDILAAIGPSIGPQSYLVGEDVKKQFSAEFPYASDLFRDISAMPSQQQLSLDLWEANRRQLLHAGVPAEHIDVLAIDTASNTAQFFSYRAEAGRTGRMMSSIGLRPLEAPRG